MVLWSSNYSIDHLNGSLIVEKELKGKWSQHQIWQSRGWSESKETEMREEREGRDGLCDRVVDCRHSAARRSPREGHRWPLSSQWISMSGKRMSASLGQSLEGTEAWSAQRNHRSWGGQLCFSKPSCAANGWQAFMSELGVKWSRVGFGCAPFSANTYSADLLYQRKDNV